MKLLLKREYGKHLNRGTVSLNGKPLCRTQEPSILQGSGPCQEGLYRLACHKYSGWYLRFEADGRRIEISYNSATGAKDSIVPVTCFRQSIPEFRKVECMRLTEGLSQCMGEGMAGDLL